MVLTEEKIREIFLKQEGFRLSGAAAICNKDGTRYSYEYEKKIHDGRLLMKRNDQPSWEICDLAECRKLIMMNYSKFVLRETV